MKCYEAVFVRDENESPENGNIPHDQSTRTLTALPASRSMPSLLINMPTATTNITPCCRGRPNGSQGRADQAAAGSGDAPAKQVRGALYSQLRTEHLEMLSQHKQFTLKTSSAQEAIDKMERMEKDVKVEKSPT